MIYKTYNRHKLTQKQHIHVMTTSIPHSEPILLPANKNFSYHNVGYSSGEQHSCFMHFHNTGELILFHQVDGYFEQFQNKVPLSAPCLVYIPPMAIHDFNLSKDEKAWQIIQFSPSVLTNLNSDLQQTLLNYQTAQLTSDEYARLLTLFSWLGDSENPQERLTSKILTLIIEFSATIFSRESVKKSPQPHAYLKKITPFIEHVQQQANVDLSLNQAAELCNMSPSYFSRYFKKVFHLTFGQYMLTYRLHLACHHLLDSGRSVTDVAYELGFSHPSHFIAKFKQTFGITPKQYQAK